jgi:hypothetical protein
VSYDKLGESLKLEPNAECATLTQFAGNTDLATMLLSYLVNNGQPEASATAGSRPGRINAVEAIKEVRQMLGGNSDATVSHFETCPFAILE